MDYKSYCYAMLFGERCLGENDIENFIIDPENAKDFIQSDDAITYRNKSGNIELIYLTNFMIESDGMPFLVVLEETRIRKYFYVTDNVQTIPAMKSCYPTYTISYYNKFEKTNAFDERYPATVLIGPSEM